MGVPILMNSFIFFIHSHFFVLAVPATSMVFILLNLPLGCTVWVWTAWQMKLLGVSQCSWEFQWFIASCTAELEASPSLGRRGMMKEQALGHM